MLTSVDSTFVLFGSTEWPSRRQCSWTADELLDWCSFTLISRARAVSPTYSLLHFSQWIWYTVPHFLRLTVVSLPGNDLIQQPFCNRLCFLIWMRKHFCPFREVVSNSQDILLTRLSSWQRAHDVHYNSLEWATWAATDKGCSPWLLWGLPTGALVTLLAPVFNIMLLAVPIEVFSYLPQALVYS